MDVQFVATSVTGVHDDAQFSCKLYRCHRADAWTLVSEITGRMPEVEVWWHVQRTAAAKQCQDWDGHREMFSFS